MSKYHSTITRRDFMKALGLGAGAVSAAGVAIPVFKDLDDMITSTPQKNYPWWVKQKDYDEITTEVDWDTFKAYDSATESSNVVTAIGTDVGEKGQKQLTDRRAAGRPGFSHRDRAISNIFTGTTLPGLTIATVESAVKDKKWNINPDDNFQTVQAALHWIGSDSVGAFTLSDKNKRLWNRGVTFNAADGEGTNTNLPASAKTCIVFNCRQSYDQKRYELIDQEDNAHKNGIPTDLGRVSPYHGYIQSHLAEYQFVRFLSGLGWYVGRTGQGPNIPFGIFAGTGELSRSTHIMTPSFGIMGRRCIVALTDLPVTPQKPIDFGGTKFCETCRRCAERCPGEAMGDENYKKPAYELINGGRPGYKGWKIDWGKCKGTGAPSACGSCHGLCPFNHQSDALIHPFVRMVSSQTSLFNSFFGAGDRIMNYAKPQTDKTLEAWWYRDLKSWAGDTIINSGRHKWNY